MRIILPFVLLCLAGCGDGPRLLNKGADWAIYKATYVQIAREYVARGGTHIPGVTYQHGFCDYDAKEIWYDGNPDVLLHEVLIHMVPRVGDPVEAAARLHSEKFNLFYQDAPARAHAIRAALMESKKASH